MMAGEAIKIILIRWDRASSSVTEDHIGPDLPLCHSVSNGERVLPAFVFCFFN